MEGKTLWLSLLMTAACGFGLGMLVLFGAGPPLPPERPKPPPPLEQIMSGALKYSLPVYRGLMEEDARGFGVPAPTMEEFRQVFPYFEELRSTKKLRVKDPIETGHLVVSLEIEKRQATIDGQTFGVDHLLLRIQNKTQRYLAYRVATQIADARKCASKGDLPHNAFVIEPGKAVVRSECLYRTASSLNVTGIEVMEIPALSAFYLSRMPATATLFDPRTVAGHVPWKGAACPQAFSWREVREGFDSKRFGWRDFMDFYARHNCQEYTFFPAYRYRSDPSGPLPVRPEN